MTLTSKKRSNSKNPPPSKGSPKGSSKTAAPAGSRKSTPHGPRGRRKKGTGLGFKLLAAFTAGIVLATLAFFLLYYSSLPSLSTTAWKNEPASTDNKQTGFHAPFPVDTPESRQIHGSDAHPKGTVPLQETLTGGYTSQEGGHDDSNAINSALTDLQSLAYEEDLSHLSLGDRIRQADYALMQTSWIRKLPARAMRLASMDEKHEGPAVFRFQNIEILPGKDPALFVESLRDCLALWAEGALLKQSAKDTWGIYLGGTRTHGIRFYPGRTEFPTPDETTVAGSPVDGTPVDGSIGSPALHPKTATVKQAKEELQTASLQTPPPAMERPRLRRRNEEAKLVIVIDDLGASISAVQRLLALDFPVTCAFWPHGAYTRKGASAAYAQGLEILVHQPMEPLGYPQIKAGPNTLLSTMNEGQIRRILNASLAAVPHAVGLNNHMGSRFTQHQGVVHAVIRLLAERGLFVLDSYTHHLSVFAAEGKRLGIEHYRRNVFLDVVHTRSKILEELQRAERIALLTGQAVAIGHPLPETLDALAEWQVMRNKEIRIVKLRDLAQD